MTVSNNSLPEFDIEVLESAEAVYSKDKIEKMFNECLDHLLNRKSLYQSLSISNDLSFLIYDEQFSFDGENKKLILQCLKDWVARTESTIVMGDLCNPGKFRYQLHLPQTVKTYCESCKSVTTHNPENVGDCHVSSNEKCYTQVFHAEYKCQDCKASVVSFLIMRRGLKFQLMGRSPIEEAGLSKEVKDALSDREAKLFGEAIMANKTGSELAAICIMRIAIEQYLRRITGNTGVDKVISGDELYEQYKNKLPADFLHGRVTSLGKIYGELSMVMHGGEYEEGIFTKNMFEVEKFFRYLALTPIQQ